ncbi:hypothetical protein [Halobacteriovorax sp. HLS]|uniref:hypothetical protein n=1 Tax=Halobacteriovorax sp. HLS TaxID=2234000 RepID=UPI000FD94D58|nr:hypothetical protein [Halobacteriovorax sp. HLS]
MNSLKLMLLLAISFVSLSQNIFFENSREIASVDCANCESELENSSDELSKSLTKIKSVLPKEVGNMALFEAMKQKHQCGEFFGESDMKFKGRLKENQTYFVAADPMNSDIEAAGMVFMMNLPNEGKKGESSSKRPFLGKSYEGDILMVERVQNGRKIIGYNVTLSLCKFSFGKKKIIHEDNKIEELAFGMMSLDTEDNCDGYLDINMSKVGFVANPKSSFKRRIPMEKHFQPIECD